GTPDAPVRRAQNLAEAGPVQVAIEATWRIEAAPEPTPSPSPATQPTGRALRREMRWRYTIRRYGRVHISMHGAPPAPPLRHPSPQAVLFDGADGGQWSFDVNNPSRGAGRFARAAARSDPVGISRIVWIVPGLVDRVVFKMLRCVGSSLRA